MIVLFYGVIGAGLIYLHRAEFRPLKPYYKYLYAGFALLFLMVLLDAFGNRSDLIELLGFEGAMRRAVWRTVSIGEELTKLLAEAAFLIGFLHIYRKLHDEGAASPPDALRVT